ISAVARPPRHLGNLPAETSSFIGRRREVAEVRKGLTDTRLVSLVGPAGVGRTRLAIRMATHLGRSLPDGAWLVELAEVRSPAAVGAVAAALDHLVPPYHPCSCLHPTPSHTANLSSTTAPGVDGPPPRLNFASLSGSNGWTWKSTTAD